MLVNDTTWIDTSSLEPGERLLDVLRDRYGLTGTKEACGRGECGACTVLVDGVPVLSCITLAARVNGSVTTVEGVIEESSELRAAFADCGAFQCGFCTPGQIVRGTALLRSGLPNDDRELRREISGNICRCTGYNGIVEALRRADAARTDAGDHGHGATP
jgi:aerobic-type carbon monoxide dehydrogenase small subunit (CoxS/CutS family)